MLMVLSRKGFDTSAGGGPSPIVDGRPVSLPIPANGSPSRTTFASLGLGGLAVRASRGKLGAEHPCHHDPMFLESGAAMLGQCGAAQTHLERQGVGPGDTFVFFGLFREDGAKPHHRIFGYLTIERIVPLATASSAEVEELAALGMPHALGMHAVNDTVYVGKGSTASSASDALRLTVPEGPPSLWRVPSWLFETGLSYHGKADRWREDGRLQSVVRGQEFVADMGCRREAREWLDAIIAAIEA